MNIPFSFFKKYWFIIFFLLIIFVLRIPSLFEPNRYADEDIYLTLGQGMREGLVFYKDIHDNKPPLLYIVAGLAGSLFWFRFILLVVHAFSVIIFFKLSKLIFEKQRWIPLLITIIFGVFSTLPPLEGNIANGENFMIVPALFGVFLVYTKLKQKNSEKRMSYFIVGLLFAISFLFKIPILFDFVGIVLFVWLLSQKEGVKFSRIRWLWSAEFLLLVLGFVGPILLSILYYASVGAFEPYVRSALMQNIGYLSSWGESSGSMFTNPLVYRGLIIFAFTIFVLFLSKRIDVTSRMVLIWSVFSLYGALLSSRPYPHYLLEPLAPYSLLLGLFVSRLMKKKWLTVSFVIVTFILAFAVYQKGDFWKYDTLPYYKNFIAYASGGKSWEEYLNYWGAYRNYQIADYIKDHTDKHDHIFVWGTEPAIYSLSQRLPVGKFTVAYHIVDFNAYNQTIEALRSSKPKYIVVIDGSPDFMELMDFISHNYQEEVHFDGAFLYRKL